MIVAAALPENAGYVAAAYLVFLALVLIYVLIMAVKLTRLERDVSSLRNEATSPHEDRGQEDPLSLEESDHEVAR